MVSTSSRRLLLASDSSAPKRFRTQHMDGRLESSASTAEELRYGRTTLPFWKPACITNL